MPSSSLPSNDWQSAYMDVNYLFPALVVARALLAFAPLPDALKHSQQLSSPLTSYTRRTFHLCYAVGIQTETADSEGRSIPIQPWHRPILWRTVQTRMLMFVSWLRPSSPYAIVTVAALSLYDITPVEGPNIEADMDSM